MEIEKGPAKQYTPKQYIVCYLDVLGIRENFLDHIDYHNSEIEQEQLKTINDTIALFHCALCSIDCLKDVQKLFETIITSLTKALPHDQEGIDCSQNQWMSNISIQHFSDSLLFYVAAVRTTGLFPPSCIQWYLPRCGRVHPPNWMRRVCCRPELLPEAGHRL